MDIIVSIFLAWGASYTIKAWSFLRTEYHNKRTSYLGRPSEEELSRMWRIQLLWGFGSLLMTFIAVSCIHWTITNRWR